MARTNTRGSRWCAIIAAALAAVACKEDPPPPVPPALVITATSLATAESGAQVSFQVSLGFRPQSASIYIIVSSGDTTEGLITIPGSGYSTSSRTLTFTTTDWNVPQTVAVVPVDDSTRDGNQTYDVTVAVQYTTDPYYANVPPRLVSVTNGDDDIPGFTLSKTTASTSESGTMTDSFTVRLTVQPTTTVTMPVTSTDPSEGLLRGPGSTTDQTTVNLTFTTSNWSTAQTVTIRGQADSVDDGNQTYAISVGPPTGAAEYAAVAMQQVSVTHIDVDTAGITVLAPPQPLRTSENATTAAFTVRLNTQPAADVVLPITSSNAGEGLLIGAGQGPASTIYLTFTDSNWGTPQSVTVTGQDDSVPGDNVTYAVTVGPATGADAVYTTLAAQQVSVLNVDNDAAAITVPEIGTTLLTSESGTSAPATFSIVLNKAPAADVVVTVTVNDPTEGLVRGGSSPTIPAQTIQVTFTPADFATPQTVAVVGQPDFSQDGNQTYTITIGPATGDPEYAAVAAQSISVTNSDVDVAGYTVSTTSLSHSEGGATTTFTVRLNTVPLADVVIPVTSSNAAEGQVSGGSLGSAFGSTLNLTFNAGNWQTAQTVSVRGPIDNVDDGNQTYTITVGPTSSSDSHYQNLPSRTISATNSDVDTAGLTVSPTSGLATTEAGGTATFTVRLATIPLGNVTVPVNITDTTEVLVSAGGAPASYVNLSFTSSNWNTLQTVTVHGQNDGVFDGAQSFTVTVGPPTSGDPKYQAIAARNVTGTNADDEVGVNECTSAAPCDVTALLPYSGQVAGGAGGYSYYLISGVTTGANVTLTNVTDDVRLDVYENPNFSSGLLCWSNASGATASETCVLSGVPAGGTLYVRVSGTATTQGAAFTLNYTAIALFGELEPNNATTTANGPYSSTVLLTGATSWSDYDYFAITNTGATAKTVTFETFEGSVGSCPNADTLLYLYNSSGGYLTSNDDSGVNWCSYLSYSIPAGATYYVSVSAYSSTNYILRVTIP